MSEELQDLERTCRDCNEPFIVSKGEQEALQRRFGDTYKPPTRCKTCRQKRKESADG